MTHDRCKEREWDALVCAALEEVIEYDGASQAVGNLKLDAFNAGYRAYNAGDTVPPCAVRAHRVLLEQWWRGTWAAELVAAMATCNCGGDRCLSTGEGGPTCMRPSVRQSIGPERRKEAS